MIAVSLTITNPDGLSAPWRACPLAIEKYLREVGNHVARAMRTTAPRGTQRIHPLSKRTPERTGEMRKAIKSIVTGKLFAAEAHVGVLPAVKHARFYTFGTKAHLIQNRRAKTLTIYKPAGITTRAGKWLKPDEYGFVHVRRVNHPGNRGKREWIDQALALALTSAERSRLWAKSVAYAMRKLPKSTATFGDVQPGINIDARGSR